ncbi:MAG: carbon-phosphorus lyase complex subunit PhnI [Actinomycetota bacterium]|nr:carbon-phosphorus lyase complex subunit PhnI [Actinomycetota bacterium]
MYATLEETDALAAARALGRAPSPTADTAGADSDDRIGALDLLGQQVCTEAGLWAPDAARRALRQTRGDVPRAVALVRVWAAALPRITSEVVADADVAITRRVSSAFAEVPGGQWLGAAPELGSRLLTWDDDPAIGAETPPNPSSASGGDDIEPPPMPTRATCPRVRDLLHDVPVLGRDPGEDERVPDDTVRPDDELHHGDDPARTALRLPYDRPTRLGVLARGETSGLVALAALVLGRRREAVLAELTTAVVGVRVAHPRTGVPCVVAEVPVVEADAVVDADVDGRAGFAIGWGASLGELDRRAVALALLDGAIQSDEASRSDGASTPIDLDTQTVTATVDGSATNGFVEHLRLPHYASFASYLDQVRRPAAHADAPTDGDEDHPDDHAGDADHDGRSDHDHNDHNEAGATR